MAKSKKGKRVTSGVLERSQLKEKVYKMSGVSTTKALKGCRREFSKLDFRRTASWKTALTHLEKVNFDQLSANPPEEYRELFSEITHSFKKSQVLLDKSDLLVQRLGDDTAALEELISNGDKD